MDADRSTGVRRRYSGSEVASRALTFGLVALVVVLVVALFVLCPDPRRL